MATVKIKTIIGRANTLLNDPGFIRWPQQELLDYYNDAAKAIVLVRPDAHTKNVDFQCVAGTKQRLPADALRLIDIPRNAGGSVVRYVPRKALDDSYPDWHVGATSEKITAYTYDERDPKVFYLYPGPKVGISVDLIYSVAPTSKSLTDVFGADGAAEDTLAEADLDDIYINPIIDFILYRAYSKDSEYSANGNRAAGHYNAFQNQLGIKSEADGAMSSVQKQQFTGVTQQ